MTVAPGTCVGPFAITAKLGEGGMGEAPAGEQHVLGRQRQAPSVPGPKELLDTDRE